MFTTIATTLLLSALALSSPILPRAGAPSITPVAPPCYIDYPMTTPNTTSNSTAYRPTANASTSLTYAWDQPLANSAYTNQSTLWADCINQCNGLQGCKSAFLAYNVPSMPVYGTAGGEPSIMCQMYSVFMRKEDFVEVKNGSYVQALAGNIQGCGK
ncbi:hypothetical protein K490DRAFT_60911 [Saccharata proteae CBS 121410]|uniref:Apple domain-containing protein n=1 Tax=Saccharata proteae CBS 121410 TaxID=1314787 RepID=A0A9P4I439_9PEZI|nr:hypothetical protein K490DRAFT_60911 [Saccharata proteae CBS 121410]